MVHFYFDDGEDRNKEADRQQQRKVPSKKDGGHDVSKQLSVHPKKIKPTTHTDGHKQDQSQRSQAATSSSSKFNDKKRNYKRKVYGPQKRKKLSVIEEPKFVYEENELMTRYDGVWVMRTAVEKLDRLKLSLEEEHTGAKSAKEGIFSAKRREHKLLKEFLQKNRNKEKRESSENTTASPDPENVNADHSDGRELSKSEDVSEEKQGKTKKKKRKKKKNVQENNESANCVNKGKRKLSETNEVCLSSETMKNDSQEEEGKGRKRKKAKKSNATDKDPDSVMHKSDGSVTDKDPDTVMHKSDGSVTDKDPDTVMHKSDGSAPESQKKGKKKTSKNKKQLSKNKGNKNVQGFPRSKTEKELVNQKSHSEEKLSQEKTPLDEKKSKKRRLKKKSANKNSGLPVPQNNKPLQFDFEENYLMTQFDGVWVKRSAVPLLKRARKENLKQIYSARKDGKSDKELTAEEQNMYHKQMKKKIRKERRNLRKALTIQRRKMENN